MWARAPFPQLPNNTPQPPDQSTFPREMIWFALAEEGLGDTSHAVVQRQVFHHLIFQLCLAGAQSQLCRRKSLNNIDREHKINTL